MEEGVREEFTACMRERFALPQADPREYSPLTLAYIGDAAYELVIRTMLVTRSNRPVSRLHKSAAELVKAERQSRMIRAIEPLFTGEEEQVYHRGRNAKSGTKAKNASVTDYRRATGFEAVMGFLYLKGEYGRMMELIAAGIDGDGETDEA